MDSAYARAGVSIQAAEEAVDMMKAHVTKTFRPEVMGAFGGFAGFFDAAAFKRYSHPVLATSTDGVGTKVAIASAMGIHDTVGYDLVGMLVDDLVVVGAEPLFVTDYIACGAVVPHRIAEIVAGVAQACTVAGASLIGGETAEHPGLLAPDEFDLAGATTGVVEYEDILGAHRVCPDDVIVCLESSGLHSNGFSLVRNVLLQQGHMSLDEYVPELGTTLGEELLRPTRIYAKHCLDVIHAGDIHALSHITGGGLANNLARVIPDSMTASVDRSTWTPGPIFGLVQRVGDITQPDIEETLNMGVGMIMVMPPESVDGAVRLMEERGIRAWAAGSVCETQDSSQRVEMVGSHPQS